MTISNIYPRPELLLQPNIIKPLHGLNPRSLKGQEWWDDIRQKVYAATDYHCAACGVHKSQAKKHTWLEAHETYQVDFNACVYECTEIVGLCHYCHNFIHSGRLRSLYKKGQCSIERYKDIMAHGLSVLNMTVGEYTNNRIALYENPKWFPEKDGSWSKWKLVLDGVEYKSLYPTFEDWKRNFSS